MSGSAFAVTHHAFSSGAGRTSDGNGSHASTLKSPSYTKSVSWQHYQQNNIIGNVGQGGQAFVRGIGQEGNIRITWIEEGKPVSCFAHYQQNTTSEKIAQSIIMNGLRCQIQ